MECIIPPTNSIAAIAEIEPIRSSRMPRAKYRNTVRNPKKPNENMMPLNNQSSQLEYRKSRTSLQRPTSPDHSQAAKIANGEKTKKQNNAGKKHNISAKEWVELNFRVEISPESLEAPLLRCNFRSTRIQRTLVGEALLSTQGVRREWVHRSGTGAHLRQSASL